jgi:hypothetical protein
VKDRGDGYAISHPGNWQVQSGKEGVTLAPERGVFFSDTNGTGTQAYGALAAAELAARVLDSSGVPGFSPANADLNGCATSKISAL